MIGHAGKRKIYFIAGVLPLIVDPHLKHQRLNSMFLIFEAETIISLEGNGMQLTIVLLNIYL